MRGVFLHVVLSKLHNYINKSQNCSMMMDYRLRTLMMYGGALLNGANPHILDKAV